MNLILSCITKGEQQTRHVLDQLTHAGIAKEAIIVLHPRDERQNQEQTSGQALAHPAAQKADASGTTVGAAASGGTVGGMFGWVVGFGVLSIPGALLGGAVGAVTGAAIGASRHVIAAHHHVPDEIQHHYASRIVDDYAAVLVHVNDLHQYQAVLTVFLDADGRHILTSRNNPVIAESDQLEVLVHHPVLIEDVSKRTASA